MDVHIKKNKKQNSQTKKANISLLILLSSCFLHSCCGHCVYMHQILHLNLNSPFVEVLQSHTNTHIMRSPYFPARSVLFRKEPGGVTYRVPALLYLSHSRSFLAFCEERLSPSDSQAHLLVMRRGIFYRNYVEVRKQKQDTNRATLGIQIFRGCIRSIVFLFVFPLCPVI